METNIVIKTIEHNGVKVSVKIDYDLGKVSLVKRTTKFHVNEFPHQEFVFNDRSLEYMNGWLNILEAMKIAIEYGKEELTKASEENLEKLVDLIDKANNDWSDYNNQDVIMPE